MNGIDHVRVPPHGDHEPPRLEIHFVHPLPGQPDAVPPDAPPLAAENVLVLGNDGRRQIPVQNARASGRVLHLDLAHEGDRSAHLVSIVASTAKRVPPPGFDLLLSTAGFLFHVESLGAGDDADPARKDEEAPPHVDYLARDYQGFRRLMLDRMALLSPQWRERNAADAGVAVVEALAHAADLLSYHQDAVATEAYLGTARRRVSVRRHARLLGYRLHEGCNARAWIAFDCAAPEMPLPRERDGRRTRLLTRLPGADAPMLTADDLLRLHDGARPLVFEPMHDALLRRAHNRILLHGWGESAWTLPRGATRATLLDGQGDARLMLRPGDVLVLEEARHPGTGTVEEADPLRRHAVRLTRVIPEATETPEGGRSRDDGDVLVDELEGVPIVEIEWHAEDALPFDLVARAVILGTAYDDAAVARANVVLADHGLTVPDAHPEPPRVPREKGSLLRLQDPDLTRAVHDAPAARMGPASLALRQDPSAALPAISSLRIDGAEWRIRPDLVESSRFQRHAVVETETDGTAYLRFGDGAAGRAPRPGALVTTTYRVGNGRVGNVGADSIAHVVPADGSRNGITRVWNPLPAQGGEDPEPIEVARQMAPHAYRRLERAVTEDDYVALAKEYPGVRDAVAFREWTGAWAVTFVAVEPDENRPLDHAFKSGLWRHLRSRCVLGEDVGIVEPRYVPLDVLLHVHVDAGHHRRLVHDALRRAFASTRTGDGAPGFFHANQWTFGQPAYLSRIVAHAMGVPGVKRVDALRFRRMDGDDATDAGVIPIGRLEIARLDNDGHDHHGRIGFRLEGGL